MKHRPHALLRPNLCGLVTALAALALSSQLVTAAPYASQVTNINYSATDSTMQFWLNESGGNVWITYEDGSTNSSFNGVSTGVNLPSGAYTFDVPYPHTSYTISAYKVGAGSPSLIQTSPGFTPRGVDVNKNPNSPYFGRVYVAYSNGSGVGAFNPDMTQAISPLGYNAYGGTCVFFGGGFSPYRIFVAADDSLMVGDASWTYGTGVTGALQNDGVWRMDPNLTGAQLFLGPRGYANGTAGVGFGPIHSTIQARPVVIGNPSSGPVNLVTVDGDYGGWTHGYNSLLVYKNINPAALPYQGVPDIQGPAVGLPISDQGLGGNAYPSLQFYGHYIYSGTYRENYGYPSVQIYTNDIGNGDTLAPVWDSITGIGGVVGTGPDVFHLTNVGGESHGIVDMAVSPDGRFCVGLSYANWFVIAYMTNGIPDGSRVFNNIPTSYTTIARGIAFDAAGNIYSSSSGIGNVQEWSAGITSTAITTGTTNGSTGFNVITPSTEVSVTATSPNASQGGSNGSPGSPVNGVFTITRTGSTSSSLPVTFTLSGSAVSGVYTSGAGVSIPTSTTVPTTNTVVMPAGQASTTITITPTTANVPRPTTTVFLQLLAGATYQTTLPFSDTVYIQNTSSNLLMVAANASTMYKAFSNDTASITLTRWGDTNVSYTIPAAAFTYTGTAMANTDFIPSGNVTVAKGNLTKTVSIRPLANGAPPVDAYPSPYPYVGDKSTTMTLAGSASYGVLATAKSAVLTLLDNATPAAPVLYSNPLTNPADASNWHITYGTGAEMEQGDNYNVEFGYDLTSNNPEAPNNDPNGIPLPPSGATSALRITCNKNYSSTYGGGVNVYYKNQAFSGNYAVRFNMNLIEGFGTFTVEGAMFGINHDGSETNWWLGSGNVLDGGPWSSDGVWYWVQAPPDGAGGFGFPDFEEYTGSGAVPNGGWTQLATANYMPTVYKPAVFTATGTVSGSGGTPANNSAFVATPSETNWSDVEIKQLNGVVTMSIDRTPLFTYTNTSGFNSGYIMFGYDAPIEGAFQQYVNSTDAAVYFSNLRVVQILPTVIINSISISGGNVVLNFITTDGTSNTPVDYGDTPASFAIQSSTGLSGFGNVAATISQLGAGSFQATLPYTGGATMFYRVHHL